MAYPAADEAPRSHAVRFVENDFGSFGLPESILPPEDPPPTPANRGHVAPREPSAEFTAAVKSLRGDR